MIFGFLSSSALRITGLILQKIQEGGNLNDDFTFQPLIAPNSENLSSGRHHNQRPHSGLGTHGSTGRRKAWVGSGDLHPGRDLHEAFPGGIVVRGIKVLLRKEQADHFSSYRFTII